MLLGSVALGWLGPAVFFLRKTDGWKKWAALVLGIVAARVLYLGLVTSSLVVTGWLDWLLRRFGPGDRSALLHYACGCLLALLTSLIVIFVVDAFARPKRVSSAIIALVLIGAGVLQFWHPDDRIVSPHPFADDGPVPASQGPDYVAVVKDGKRAPYTRICAALGAARHAVSSRSGWGGVIREELLARYRSNPDQPLRDRVPALEAALRIARPELTPQGQRTSLRTLRSSSGSPTPARSGTRR